MSIARLFVKGMIVGLLALLVVSLGLAYFVSYADSAYQPTNRLGLTASGVVTLTGAMHIGGALVALYGAPLFAALASRGRATWALVLLFGTIPGLLAFFYQWPLGLFFMACGVLVAAIVRWVCGPGPNNSFKPKPLRGSA